MNNFYRYHLLMRKTSVCGAIAREILPFSILLVCRPRALNVGCRNLRHFSFCLEDTNGTGRDGFPRAINQKIITCAWVCMCMFAYIVHNWAYISCTTFWHIESVNIVPKMAENCLFIFVRINVNFIHFQVS